MKTAPHHRSLTCTARDACLAAAVTEETGRGQQSMFGIRGGLTSKQRWNRKKRDAARAARERKQSGPCGTTAAYYQHLMAGEPVDEACQAASDTYEQQLTPPPGPPACGTRGGCQKHVREHTTICTPCRQANTDADRRLRNTGTTKANPERSAV